MAGLVVGYSEDEKILQSLKAGEEGVIREIFKSYFGPFCAAIIRAFKSDIRHVRDIYSESFSILYFNIQREQLGLPLRSSLKTYLIGIGRNVYMRRYMDKFSKSSTDFETVPEQFSVEHAVDVVIEKKERAVQLQILLEKLGEPCSTLLRQVYYYEMKYDVLSIQYREAENTLRKRKHDCLKKLRSMISVNQIQL